MTEGSTSAFSSITAAVSIGVAVGVAVVAAESIDAAAITAVVAVSVIVMAIVAIAYDSSPFTAGCQRLLSVIMESFAAVESCYLGIAQV